MATRRRSTASDAPRREAARREARDRHSITLAADRTVRPSHQTELDDLFEIIHEEVVRLPARYRDAVVLCDLEGCSYAAAASRLRCALGTVQSRLARGRARLRSRLIRRGLVPIALESFLIERASASVPERLAEATVRTAVAMVTGKLAPGLVVSVTAPALADSVTRSPGAAIAKTAMLALAAVSIAIASLFVANNAHSDSRAPAPAVAEWQQQHADEPEPTLTLQVEALSKADASPLAGATVWVRAVSGRVHTWEGTTDEQGRYALVLPGPATTRLDVLVAHRGYGTGGRLGDVSGRAVVNYTFRLDQPEMIGGIVRDEAGRPIEGARVFPWYPGEDVIWPEVYSSPNSSLAIATTDAQGRWRAAELPANAGPDATFTVVATHPDHIATQLRTTARNARAFSIEQVMKKGVPVSGTVLSPFGRPVEGASILLTVPPSDRMFLRLTTDKTGQFHSGRCFDPIRTKPVMTVLAPGLAMAAREIVVRPDAPAQVVRLSRRRPIEGQVVDSKGRPVVGATVSPSLTRFKGMLDWDAETGPDGRFVWYDAPATGMILLDVYKPDYRPVRERAVDPDANPLTITLHHPQRKHGTVTDAETGRPIGRFTLIQGTGPSLQGMRPVWSRDNIKDFAGDRFDLSYPFMRDDNSRQSIRIEADGYQPAEFLGFPGNDEDVRVDFKLRKAVPLSGIVRGPDGKPVASPTWAPAGSKARFLFITTGCTHP